MRTPSCPARVRAILVAALLTLALPGLTALPSLAGVVPLAGAAEPEAPTGPEVPTEPVDGEATSLPTAGMQPGTRVTPPGWPQVDAAPMDAAPAEADPESSPSADVPADPTKAAAPAVTLTGGGWGHSVGMSQYGAQAMARAGRTWQQILAHYYTGITLGTWAAATGDEPSVHTNLFLRRSISSPTRVDLRSVGRASGTPTSSVRVTIGGRVVTVPADADGLRVTWDVGRRQLVLHRGSSEVGRGPDSSPVVVRPDPPAGANPALLRLPQVGGSGRLAGTFQWGRLLVHASPAGGGRLEPVLEQPLRTYLFGIAEVPSSWDLAAQQAQAVAARTYVAGFFGTNPATASCRCHVGATPAYQNYVGWAHEAEVERYGNRWRDAVDGTRGAVASHGGRLAGTYYSSSHGGRSEDSEDSWAYSAEVPYLRSVDDPWSAESPGNSLRSWTATVPNADVARLVGLARVDTIAVVARTPGGSPRTLRVTGRDGAGRAVTRDWSGSKGAGAALRTGLRVTMTSPSSASWMTTLPSMQLQTIRVAGQPVQPESSAPTPTPTPTPAPTPSPAPSPTPTPTPTPTPGSWEGTFRDDDGSVHEEAVEAVVTRGITTGCAAHDPTLYCPDAPVTRGQMATFLARATGATTGATPTFRDVRGSVHGAAVAALAERGVVSGFGDGTFRPDLPVTREQMASFLARALELRPVTSRAFLFRDVVPGSVHLGAVGALQEAGISSGCGPYLFCPTSPVNRAQMATFLARSLDL